MREILYKCVHNLHLTKKLFLLITNDSFAEFRRHFFEGLGISYGSPERHDVFFPTDHERL